MPHTFVAIQPLSTYTIGGAAVRIKEFTTILLNLLPYTFNNAEKTAMQYAYVSR